MDEKKHWESEEKTEVKIDNDPDNNISKATEKLKGNPWIIVSIILLVLVIILLILNFRNFRGGVTGNAISGDDASSSIVNYLNSKTGGGVEFVSYDDVGSLYEVTVSYQGQDIPVYITKDGEYFIQGAIPITGDASSNTQTETEDIPKTDKPIIDLYVMSFCPYGNQAEETMLPVYQLLKDQADWNIHFIVSVNGDTVNSLHGPKEVKEDEIEACVLDQYGVDTWFTFANYVNANCGSDGSCWEDAAKESNVDVNKINSCVSSKGLELMKENEEASTSANANGSPTLIVNGVKSNSVYQYGNSDAYKSTICSAFNEVPSECGESVGSSTSTSTGGSC